MNYKRKFQRLIIFGIVCGISVTLLLTVIMGLVPVAEFDSSNLSVSSDLLRTSMSKLLVIIISAAKNADRRNAIRQTWLSEESTQALDVQYYFVVGTEGILETERNVLNFEMQNNNDLLLLNDVKDSYDQLTHKLLASMQWINEHTNFEHLLKVDDDSFVVLSQLLELLSFKNRTRLYLGFFDGSAQVKRRGQWAELNWKLCDRYLPYARGGGYVLSHDLVAFIASNANLLQRYNSEDVSVGAWLAGLDIERVHDPRFDTEYVSRGCHNSYIVTHKQSVTQMVDKWQTWRESGVICANEFRSRLSYVYNWDVPPSKCCVRNDTTVP